MSALRDRYDSHYCPRAVSFVKSIDGIDASGIPEPHLPLWGSLYEDAPLKVGLIWRDTRKWGDMNGFITAVKIDPVAAVHSNEAEFHDLAFTTWTNNFGKTFWDTSMRFLAGLYGIPDWKRLKRQEEKTVLRSFFWANASSVERYEVTPQKNGVPWQTWQAVKAASERHFDSLSTVLETFRPHIVILMHWHPGAPFLDLPLKWQEFGDHQAYAAHEATSTHIFATAHPTWLNKKSLYETAVTGIIQKAKTFLPISAKAG